MEIVLLNGQNVWFTSDTHYGHKNICRGVTDWDLEKTGDDEYNVRDFETLDSMNAMIVDKINQKVLPDDILIHLGDFSFGGFDNIRQFRERIACKNIHLVLGNHDNHIRKNIEGISEIFSSVHPYLDLLVKIEADKKGDKMKKYRFICMHYPIASWDEMRRGVMHLHGHTHLNKKDRIHEGRSMDVGLEGNDLSPISLFEVVKLLKDRPIQGISIKKDHHLKK